MTCDDVKQNFDYEELTVISHDEIKPMVLKEIAENQNWSRVANMYQITGILAFVLGAFKAFMTFFLHREVTKMIWIGYGLFFTFTLLIVFHELIHAAAYRFVGAKNLSFGARWKKFMFYVQADRQVLGYEQFKIVALSPAVVVSVLSLAGMAIFYNQPLFYFFIPVFAFHSLFCGGDFGLLCYFQNRPEMEIVTFDVKEEGKTYFYGKRKNG